MATDKKPKGILKTASSFDNPPTERERKSSHSKEMKWDEMNILATHHPPDKDYGHMKIDEPPTPYSKYSDVEDDDDEVTRRNSVGKLDDLDPESVASRLQDMSGDKGESPCGNEDESSDEDLEESPEQREKRKLFEQKRKLHYNEFQAVKLAKQLMAEEDDDDDDDEEEENKTKKDSNVIDSEHTNTSSISQGHSSTK